MKSSRMTRYLALAATIAVMQLVVSGCAGVQSAPTAGHSEKASKRYYPVTAAMSELGDALWELIDPEDVSHEDHSWADGYASYAYVDGTVEIWWKGPLPDRVADEIARHPDVTTVVHEDARYSQDEMGDAQEDLMHWAGEGHGLGEDVWMSMIGPTDKGRSLEAWVVDPNGEWSKSDLKKTLTDRVGIPVKVHVRAKPWATSLEVYG